MEKPKIRFKGYQEDWEQRKVTELLKNSSSAMKIGPFGSALKKEYFVEEGIKVYAQENAFTGDFSMGDYYITEDKYKELKSCELYPGDLVISMMGTIGACAIFPKNAEKGIMNSHLLRLQFNNEVIPEYIMYLLRDSVLIRKQIDRLSVGSIMSGLSSSVVKKLVFPIPKLAEQKRIVEYLDSIDRLITLHQRKCEEMKTLKKYMLQKMFPQNGQSVPQIRFSGFTEDWEQRKFGDLADYKKGPFGSAITKDMFVPKSEESIKVYEQQNAINKDWELERYFLPKEYALTKLKLFEVHGGDIIVSCAGTIGEIYEIPENADTGVINQALMRVRVDEDCVDKRMFKIAFSNMIDDFTRVHSNGSAIKNIPPFSDLKPMGVLLPSLQEQKKIGAYFDSLDYLITLHHRKQIYVLNTRIYTKTTLIITKEKKKMPELEKVIEDKLIEQLVFGESQWTYREDLKTEEDLWKNFRYILEQNNKARLDGQPLSDAEFEQVKNQLQFSSFYKAGEWLVGENGKAMVHVQRDTEKLHLVVMNHEHIAGGSSVYEVINQYNALKDDDITTVARDRRFDVTLMINGLPMIHIELKNRQHSYMDAFYQIKKYISEGKFTGIFSAVQMFVISNGVDTKYFAAASDTELNPKFMSGWVDTENNPVADYIDFAKNVLRIPEAHEMIARYTVLDEDAKRLILLRPYQIHAIESIREASKTGKSGFVWHTTGSGKTLTSYKATRNLLMDIPAIDKAIFLIDRKDLDTQTTMAFQAYANNDLVDVDETDNVNDLKKKLKSDDRQVIVTTIQKMQILISKRLQEGTSEYSKIKNLKIAFVVDECHRAVTPKTKRELERFFGRSLWYGFTGTPRFAENPYPQMGDLPRTTEELYGKRLHKYTIQNAIHDNAVLGFQVEHNGPKNITDETDASAYDNETHMPVHMTMKPICQCI